MGVCDIMPTYCSRTFVTWHLKTTYYSLVERALLEIGTHVAHTEQNISGNPFVPLEYNGTSNNSRKMGQKINLSYWPGPQVRLGGVRFVRQYVICRAFWTQPFHRTRTQTKVRNSDSDSGSDIRNRDFPTP
jgi:hypothetical protein